MTLPVVSILFEVLAFSAAAATVGTTGGCNDFYGYHVADKSDDENGISYCRYFYMEVYSKRKCLYYKNLIGKLVKTINDKKF